MNHVEAATERSVFGWHEGGIRVPEEHEDIPDPELSWEGDGVVEEGEVPAGTVSGGLDVELGLGTLVMQGSEKDAESLTSFLATSPPSSHFLWNSSRAAISPGKPGS